MTSNIRAKWKYGRFVHAKCIRPYRNSWFIVHLAMGQIPHSTERIYSSSLCVCVCVCGVC